MLATDAPSTLRTPISLVRCSAVKAARPNSPRAGNENGENGKVIGELRHHLLTFIEFGVFFVGKLISKWKTGIEFFAEFFQTRQGFFGFSGLRAYQNIAVANALIQSNNHGGDGLVE
jgi:hypothetical protein